MTNEAFADWLATAEQADWTADFPQLAPRNPLDQQSVADRIKARADKTLRDNLAQTQRLAARLCQLADHWSNRYVLARARQIDGNIALIGKGEFVIALTAFEQAHRLFTENDFTVEAARTAIGWVAVLTRLGRFAEAIEAGNSAASVLDEWGESADYARLLINLAMLHDQQGETQHALSLLNDAKRRYQQLDEPQRIAGIDLNRAILLNYLGRFADSIAASQQAHKQFAALGQTVEAARALQGQADTYVLLGNYNRALQLFDAASAVYEADNRVWDSLYVQLHASQLLLYLGRYATVLQRAEPLLIQFEARQAQMESADLLTYIGAAHRGLNNFSMAEACLRQAHDLFAVLGNQTKQAQTELALAHVALSQGRHRDVLQQANRLADRFAGLTLPIQQIDALLLAARASFLLGEVGESAEIIKTITSHTSTASLPHLRLRAEQLAAQIALAQDDLQRAAAQFATALDTLDTVSGAIMLEQRADFMRDKAAVYGEAVVTQLRLGDVTAAFAIAERTKSRALVELLAYRVDLSIKARASDDRALVQQFNELVTRRNQILRRQQISDGNTSSQNTLHTIEQQLVAVRERLLVRHADYSRDLSLLQQQVALDSLQASLPENSAIIEFLWYRDNCISFYWAATRLRHLL